MTELSKNFLNTVLSQVTIVDSINITRHVCCNFDLIKNQLSQTKKEYYHSNEFYLAYEYDPEYYMPGCVYGLNTFNLVRTFQELDISLGKLIFVTNRVNHLEEFKKLIPESMHAFELPTVIDGCWSAFENNGLNDFMFTEPDVNATSIQYHEISMMGVRRVHRNALVNYLIENNLIDKIAVAYGTTQ